MPDCEKAEDKDGRKLKLVGETCSRMSLKLPSWGKQKNEPNDRK
jgi:hypothetical protein